MMRALALASAMLLASCATTPKPASSAALFDDSLFAPRGERIAAEDVFAPSPQMLAFAANEVAAAQRTRGRQQGLLDALYRNGEPWLDYDATLTRTASEAFAARSGNCMSLVLMTAAFARQLGLAVRYQSVYTEQSWSRGDGLSYLNGHVNVVLLAPYPGPGGPADAVGLEVDFAPIETPGLRRVRVLEEKTIVAMYMNNRAVELLAQRELDRAYWWAKAALAHDPAFLDSVNTLAVVYKARGRLADSERALRWLLDQEPDNLVALDNLVRVLEAGGRGAEAAPLAARMKELRPIPPFHFYDLGMAALQAGDYPRARALFLREMRRDARYDRFHASLALADYGMGNLADAQARMAIAVRNSTTGSDRENYSRMLARMRAGQHP